MATKNQSSSILRPVLDLHRGGMSVWISEQNKPRRTNYSLPHDDLSWESHDEIAEWFVQSIAQSRLGATEIELLLPRSSVCLHLLELPRTDDSHLKGMIQIHIETLYGERSSTIAFDYSPFELVMGSEGQRFVLLATIPRALLDSIQRLCQAANLILRRIQIRDLTVNLAFSDDPMHINFFAWVDDHNRTIGIAVGNHVIQTISIPITSQLPVIDVFRGYERRLLQSLPNGCREFEIGQRLAFVTVSDPAQQQLTSEWTKSVGLQLQPISSPGELSQVVPSLSSRTTHVIDFCNPFQTTPARSLRRPAMMVAVLALLGVASFFVHRYVSRAAWEVQLSNLKSQIEETRFEVDTLSELVQQFELAKHWRDSRVHWGRELSLVSKQLSTTKNTYLYGLQMDSFDGERLPIIRMDGRATSVPDAMKWNRQLSRLNNRYSIQPQSLDSGVTDPDYPTQFRVEVQLNQKDTTASDTSTQAMHGGGKPLESGSTHLPTDESEGFSL